MSEAEGQPTVVATALTNQAEALEELHEAEVKNLADAMRFQSTVLEQQQEHMAEIVEVLALCKDQLDRMLATQQQMAALLEKEQERVEAGKPPVSKRHFSVLGF